MDKQNNTATFLSRFCAYMIDNLLAYVLPLMLLFTYFPETLKSLYKVYNQIPFWLIPTLSHTYITLLFGYFLVKKHTTPGKMLLRLEIKSSKKELTLPQLFLREMVGKQLSAITYNIGYLIALFRDDSKALHDLVAKTIVIKKPVVQELEDSEESNIQMKGVLILMLLLIGVTKFTYDFKNKVTSPGLSVFNFFNDAEDSRSVHSVKNLAVPLQAPSPSYTSGEPPLTELDQLGVAQNKVNDIKNLPDDVELKKEVVDYLANTHYKFSYHLNDKQKEQEYVKEVAENFASKYEENFIDYMIATKQKLGEWRLKNVLIHPDYFKEDIFVSSVLEACTDRNFKPREVIPFYNDSSFFKIEDKEKFLKWNGRMGAKLECYPLVFEKDDDFLIRLTSQPNARTRIEEIAKINKSPAIQKRYVDKTLESLRFQLGNSSRIIQILQDDLQRSEDIQNWVAIHTPSSLKYFNSEVELYPSTLDKLIENHYNPKRFLSEKQLKDEVITNKLKDIQFNAAYLEKMKEQYLKSVQNFRCCGTGFMAEVQGFVAHLPEELTKNENFHIEVLKRLRSNSEYLNIIPTTPSMRAKLLALCNQTMNIHYSPSGFSHLENPQFFESINEECQVNRNKKFSNRPVINNGP